MTRSISYMEAIGEALAQEMRRDPTVVAFGEDSIGGMGASGKLGNAWGPTKELHREFPDRVLDTPITEAAFVGAAVGAAATGLRPVADILFTDFIGVCFDQILNQAAKLRFMLGGTVSVPMVVRTLWGAGMRRGAHHSQALYPLVTHVPGLKVVVPATPFDAKGLMAQAIRDPDPVIFFEHKMLYWTRGEVPEEPYTVPFGQAAVVREGADCTIVAIGAMVQRALQAAESLAAAGIDCEVVDPRTLSPLDEGTIYRSVEKTGHLVVADESNPRCGAAADIAALVAQNRWAALRGPVRMVTAPHAPTAYSPLLEDLYVPDAEAVAAAVRQTLGAVPAAG
ncbi:alpha-ketoacid dehydrogenase subunit beta [Kitasatospora viridis]|uniref:Pyruvate dehydrogenase E1 component beta subunit n=1 Tax=Kitasatospora viridis TaxID=281105 RepID=A0A561UCG0_9ACTN|nr:transketolase C-terminal domain-containing protein [Kitasatospora viridis]TWF97054.1 pyruvate dehydrogenase E1 component beta subunit [Kitasatospora viridis]